MKEVKKSAKQEEEKSLSPMEVDTLFSKWGGKKDLEEQKSSTLNVAVKEFKPKKLEGTPAQNSGQSAPLAKTMNTAAPSFNPNAKSFKPAGVKS